MNPAYVLGLLAARNAVRHELRAANQRGSGVRWSHRRQLNRELYSLNAVLDSLDPAALRALALSATEAEQ